MYSRNIGIAIYPEKLDLPTTLTYLKQARQHGITRLYATFLQIAMVDAENKDQILNTYQQIFQAAKAMGYEITLDVAPRVFSLLNLAPNDLSYFHNLGVDVMRYDALGDAKLLSELTYNDYGMAIELQMSNDDGSLEHIMSFKPLCLKLQGCQNFYPQVWTGLSEAFMRQTNAPFHNHNLKINGNNEYYVDVTITMQEMKDVVNVKDKKVTQTSGVQYGVTKGEKVRMFGDE